MKIGLVIAVSKEIKAFLGANPHRELILDHNNEIHHTYAGKNEIFACKSGCGLIDAAAITQLLISKFDCDVILNYGVTGALKEELKVEDIFIVKSAVNTDFDVSPVDPLKKHQYVEYDDIYIPLDEDLIKIAQNILPDVKLAVCASGDRFVDDKEEKIKLRNLGCDICDMELAAIARTCNKCGVKCLSIKCISDTLEGGAGDFRENIIKSAKKAFTIIQGLFDKL